MKTKMKEIGGRLLLWAALLTFAPSLRASVVLNSTNFPDEVFRNYISDCTKVDIGGTITDAKIKNCTYIEVNDLGITTLKGVEYFTSLKDLYARNNNISSVDLSHNTLLENLSLNGNNLSELDVSNNPLLFLLGCADNKLTKLDVTHLTKLGRLWCEGNQLTSLDVSNSPNLHWMTCQNNLLKSLDLSNNPKIDGEHIKIGPQKITQRFDVLHYNSNTQSCWAMYVGNANVSRIKNLKMDDVTSSPMMVPEWSGWMVISYNLKCIPSQVTYEYDTGNTEGGKMKVTINYHIINYGVKIAGTELTSRNFYDIPGLRSGTAYVKDEPEGTGWAGTPTLYLDNASIDGKEGINNEGCYYNFKINVKGKCEVRATQFNALQCDNATKTTLMGGGRLRVKAIGDKWHGVYLGDCASLIITEGTKLWADGNGYGLFDDNGRLTIDANSVLCAYGRQYASVELPSEENRTFASGITLRYPSDAKIDGNHVYYRYTETDVRHRWVVFGQSGTAIPSPYRSYGLRLGGVNVTEDNASYITDATIEGTVTFDPQTYTLTLDHATINSPDVYSIYQTDGFIGDKLKIVLIGDNYVNAAKAMNPVRLQQSIITGTGSLTVDNGKGALRVCDEKELTVSGGCTVVAGNFWGMNVGKESLVVEGENTKIKAYKLQVFGSVTLKDGLTVTKPKGGYYDTEKQSIVYPSGSIAYNIEISRSNAITTGVEAIDADTSHDDQPIYNLQGQRVGKDYKGIVIKDGHKVLGN